MNTAQQKRDYDRDMKRAERQRYRDARLQEVTCLVPDNKQSKDKLREFAKKLCK